MTTLSDQAKREAVRLAQYHGWRTAPMGDDSQARIAALEELVTAGVAENGGTPRKLGYSHYRLTRKWRKGMRVWLPVMVQPGAQLVVVDQPPYGTVAFVNGKSALGTLQEYVDYLGIGQKEPKPARVYGMVVPGA